VGRGTDGDRADAAIGSPGRPMAASGVCGESRSERDPGTRTSMVHRRSLPVVRWSGCSTGGTNAAGPWCVTVRNKWRLLIELKMAKMVWGAAAALLRP